MSNSAAPVVETTRQVNADAPWLGLLPFTEATQRYFFGRDAELREMYLRVRDTPLTVLFGQSGLGKTSLLGAGLLPKLRVEGFAPVLLRLALDKDATPLLAQVRAALAEACASKEVSADALLARWGDTGLWEIVHRLDLCPQPLAARPPVLILDQFEEVFTLGREHRNKEEMLELGRALADVTENRMPEQVAAQLRDDPEQADRLDFSPSPLRLVLTLREDYLSHLEEWKFFFPSLMRNRMALHLLRGPQALEAVVRPARLDGRNLVADGVAEEIVRRIAGASANTPMEEIEAVPPLLSLFCDELNRARGAEPQITLDLVQQQHANILQAFYERSFDGWPPALRHLVEDHLITVGGHRSSMAWEDAEAELTQAGVDNPPAALKALVACRLLSIEERGRLQRLELTHDVLTPLVVASRDTRRQRERAEQTETERQAALAMAEKEKREKRRLRTWAIAASVAALLAFAAMGLAYWGMDRAKTAEVKALLAQSQAMFQRAVGLIEDDRAAEAVAVLCESLQRPLKSFATQDRFMSLVSQRNFPVPTHFLRHLGIIRSAIFNHDGTRILTTSSDGAALVWDARSGQQLFELKHENHIKSAVYSHDGTRILTTSSGLMARIWDAQTGKPLSEPLQHVNGAPPQHEDEPIVAVFSPDDSRFLTAALEKGAVQVWDAKNFLPFPVPIKSNWSFNSVVFSPNGTRILTALGGSDAALVWDVQTSKLLNIPIRHGDQVLSAVFSPDGTRIVTASEDKTVRIWDAQTGEPLKNPLQHDEAVISAVFSPDGTRIVTASLDETFRIWDAETSEPLSKPIMSEGALLFALFNTDGTRILTTSLDKTARIWDVNTGEPLTEPIRHEVASFFKDQFPITPANFSPDGRRILTIYDNHSACIWEAQTDKPFFELIKTDPFETVVLSPDRTRILATSHSKSAIQLWDVQTGKLLTDSPPYEEDVRSAIFSPNSTYLLTISGNMAQIWEAQTSKRISEPLSHEKDIHSAIFSPNSTYLLTISGNMAQIWEAQTGKRISEPLSHEKDIHSATFSPNSTYLLTISGNMAQIWEAQTGKRRTGLRHEFGIESAGFDPDGTRIITNSIEGINIWNAQNGKPLIEPLRDKKGFSSAIFSTGGQYILTTSADNKVRIWDAQNGLPLTDSFRHDHMVKSAVFSPNGSGFVTVSWDNTARVWDLGWHLRLAPPWFLQLAEALAGRRLNDLSIAMPVPDPPAEIQAIKSQYIELGNPEDPYVQRARRLLNMD